VDIKLRAYPARLGPSSIAQVPRRVAPRELPAAVPARTPSAPHGTSAAPETTAMTAKTKRPSEAWTVPLHIVVWTAIIVGFIMALVVLMLH
jgi:hypothetical protein